MTEKEFSSLLLRLLVDYQEHWDEKVYDDLYIEQKGSGDNWVSTSVTFTYHNGTKESFSMLMFKDVGEVSYYEVKDAER